MHYERKIEQDKCDVRSKTYYIYKCSICGEEKWFNWVSNFETSRLRKCPNCGIEDDTSDKEYLIKRKHELEQQIKGLTDELTKISGKLEAVLRETEKEKIICLQKE